MEKLNKEQLKLEISNIRAELSKIKCSDRIERNDNKLIQKYYDRENRKKDKIKFDKSEITNSSSSHQEEKLSTVQLLKIFHKI